MEPAARDFVHGALRYVDDVVQDMGPPKPNDWAMSDRLDKEWKARTRAMIRQKHLCSCGSSVVSQVQRKQALQQRLPLLSG